MRGAIGDQFKREFDECIEWLRENPQTPPKIFQDARGKTLRRFPYKIIYRVEGKLINVLTVVHTARKDKIWQKEVRG